MFSRQSTTARRTAGRIAIAGAIALIPVAAVTVPASADLLPTAPGITDIDRPGHRDWDDRDRDDRDWNRHDRDRHDRDRDWDRHDRDWDRDWDRHDRGRGNDLMWWLRHGFPGGSFGSS